MKKKKHYGIAELKSKYGLLFIMPWFIGFIVFVSFPLIQSIVFSFSDVLLTDSGVQTKFIGLESYRYYLNEHPYYNIILTEDLTTLLYSLPLIILLSMVLALMLNQEFRGRLFFRCLYFMPVIITTGVVVELLFKPSDSEIVSTGVNSALTDSLFDIEDVVNWFDISDKLAQYVKVIINNVFDLLWNCGIQTVLFIAGLQSIPRTLYEASRVEGATKWEEFWFITFPMLGSVTLLVLIFTVVDLLTSTQRQVINLAYSQMRAGVYDSTSAMLWFYFLIVGVIIGVIIFLYDRVFMRRWR